MSNTLAVLTDLLRYALKDTADATWVAAEKDDAVVSAVRGLYPRFLFQLAPASYTQAVVDGTYTYALSADIVALSRVDWVDADGNEHGPLDGSVWDVEGDLLLGTAKIRLAPAICSLTPTIRYYGYGKYDTVTNLIPDELVPLVVSTAQAQLQETLLSDRARFANWQLSNPTLNVTVNELVQQIESARRRRDQLWARNMTWKRPVEARLG